MRNEINKIMEDNLAMELEILKMQNVSKEILEDREKLIKRKKSSNIFILIDYNTSKNGKVLRTARSPPKKGLNKSMFT